MVILPMELRPAELEDLIACAQLPSTVASGHVWQLTLARDPAATLAMSEYTMALRCLRLPRPVTIGIPGEPLDAIWKRATAVFVAAQNESIAGFIVLTPAEERSAAMLSFLPPTGPKYGNWDARSIACWARIFARNLY